MGMLLGSGGGLLEWRGQWVRSDCPLARVDFAASADGHVSAVDNAAHQLWHGGRVLPCDRDIEALRLWEGQALLLSSDTDCLALADADGVIRTARVGVYPQDMAVQGNTAYICGGADGQLHLLTLPQLQSKADYPLPGMPERIALSGDTACLLTLLAEQDVQTALLQLDLDSGRYTELARFPGLPGAILADESGLWVAVSEQLLHLPAGDNRADLIIEGLGLVRHMDAQGDQLLATDPLEELCVLITPKPRPAVEVLYRGDAGQAIFS